MKRTLHVYVEGRLAGALTQDASGRRTFTYHCGYRGVPLSLSMPVRNVPYRQHVIDAFLWGLLPDSAEVRRAMGRKWGVSESNPFALLEHMGLDCPGAVQFVAPEDESTIHDRSDAQLLIPISRADIGARLHTLRTQLSRDWSGDAREHWSLGGQQSKFALRKRSNGWFLCEGDAATTHLLKPGIPDLRLQALNEFICLSMAAKTQINASHVAYEEFDGEPAIVIERYDRLTASDGDVIRIHQEDLCQALSVPPSRKYQSDQGPTAIQVVDLLTKVSGPDTSSNLTDFLSLLFYNYLIGAPDAHAKNYSVLLHGDQVLLAPAYDVASGLMYGDEYRFAMSIGGEDRFGWITAHEIGKFSQQADVDMDACMLLMTTLAQEIPDAMSDTFRENGAIPHIGELRKRFEPGIVDLCNLTIANLRKGR